MTVFDFDAFRVDRAVQRRGAFRPDFGRFPRFYSGDGERGAEHLHALFAFGVRDVHVPGDAVDGETFAGREGAEAEQSFGVAFVVFGDPGALVDEHVSGDGVDRHTVGDVRVDDTGRGVRGRWGDREFVRGELLDPAFELVRIHGAVFVHDPGSGNGKIAREATRFERCGDKGFAARGIHVHTVREAHVDGTIRVDRDTARFRASEVVGAFGCSRREVRGFPVGLVGPHGT